MANKIEVGKTYVYAYDCTRDNGLSILGGTLTAEILGFIGNDELTPLPMLTQVKQIDISTTKIEFTKTDSTLVSIACKTKGHILFNALAGSDFTIPNDLKAHIFEITNIIEVFRESTNEWVVLPCPSAYNGSSSTLVDSARNTKGYIIAQVVRDDIAKIEMSFNFMNTSDYSNLCKLWETKYGGAFFNYCVFFNGTLNRYDIRQFYPSDRKFTTALMQLQNGKPQGYQNVALNLIEV